MIPVRSFAICAVLVMILNWISVDVFEFEQDFDMFGRDLCDSWSEFCDVCGFGSEFLISDRMFADFCGCWHVF